LAEGTDATSATEAILTPLRAATTAAEQAIRCDVRDDAGALIAPCDTAVDQLSKIESLVAAKRSQDQEEAAWGERVETRLLAKQAADTALSTAADAVTAVKDTLSTRSWIFPVLGYLGSSDSTANLYNADW
jgi:uncharacterized protein YhaN